jgi:hypothetical protein
MTAPPRRAELLLEALGAPTPFREVLLGDLAEEFALRADRDGPAAARRWYYRESIRATPYLLRGWMRGVHARDLTHLAGVILSSYVFLVMLGGFLAATVQSVVGAFGLALELRSLRPGDPLLLAIGLPLGSVGTVMGGYIAAWLYDRAPLIGALALSVVWACVDFAALAMVTSAPVWYGFAVAVVVLVGTTTGGVLRVCTSRSPASTARVDEGD